MIVYRLEVAPSDSDGEGEDHDEWFSSLQAAKKRRGELIKQDPDLEDHRYGEDFEIEKITLADDSRLKLILAILNRTSFYTSREQVVPPYKPVKPCQTE